MPPSRTAGRPLGTETELMPATIAHGLMPLCWWLLAGLQVAWHGIAAPPLGNQNWLLATIAVLPLMLFARTALHRGARGRFWGMFLVMLYFIVAVTETWSNANQRLFAVIQLLLCLAYFAGLVWLSRSPAR